MSWAGASWQDEPLGGSPSPNERDAFTLDMHGVIVVAARGGIYRFTAKVVRGTRTVAICLHRHRSRAAAVACCRHLLGEQVRLIDRLFS